LDVENVFGGCDRRLEDDLDYERKLIISSHATFLDYNKAQNILGINHVTEMIDLKLERQERDNRMGLAQPF
jgi:hypothetical protein